MPSKVITRLPFALCCKDGIEDIQLKLAGSSVEEDGWYIHGGTTHDGDDYWVPINFCPWCGKKLPTMDEMSEGPSGFYLQGE